MSAEKKNDLPDENNSQATESTKSPLIPPPNQNQTKTQSESNELDKANEPSSQLTNNNTEIQNQSPNPQTQNQSKPSIKHEQKLSQSAISDILKEQEVKRRSLANNILKTWDPTDDRIISNDIISINVSATPLKFGEYNEIPVHLNVRPIQSPSNNQKTNILPNKYNKKPIGFGTSSRDDISTIGLQVIFDTPNGKAIIKGTPLKAGDYDYNFIFLTSIDFSQDKLEVHKGCIKITVNADPKTLWQTKEPEEDLYRKPHTDHRQITRESITLAGASRRGRSHAHTGSFRDDDFELALLDEYNIWIIAVADGAGSSKLSRRGSQIACQTTLSQITERIQALGVEKINTVLKNAVLQKDEDFCKKFLQVLVSSAYNAFTKINEEAKNTEKSLKEFATTLNITLVKKFENTWFLGTFSIGDGGVAAIDQSGNIINLNEYDEGEFAGQTRFLTTSEIWNSAEEQNKRIRCAFVDNLKYVFASTDGINDPYFPTMNDFKSAEKWKTFIAELDKETSLSTKPEDLDQRLLEWLNFWSVGNHDDRTIAIFVA